MADGCEEDTDPEEGLMAAPICKRCGARHWNIIRCDGTRPNVDAAHQRRELRRNGIETLEHVDSPPLPAPADGFRPWGDRIDSWNVLPGGTLMRKDTQ